ncbi:hypothetical protein BurJ1DRAFT_0922 [Burkholderiales bacterium JOSHI_001]|nr:hypothetical protein BurJ1DRAFT_0922 [Burkholderiales bacterium JOSHI_001]
MTHANPSRRPGGRIGAAASCLTLSLALSACGGGGGGAGEPAAIDTGVPAAPTAQLAASQDQATALVRLAEQRTRDLRLAAGVSAVPQAGQGRALAALARGPLARIQAVQDFSAELCSSGQLSVTVADELLARFNNDANAQMRAGDAIEVSSAACTIQAPLLLGDVALGDFGVGAVIDGGFKLVLEQRSGADFLFSLTYSAFRYAPAGSTPFDPLNAVLRFGQAGGAAVYTLDFADARLLEAPVVSAVGNTIAVDSARLRAALASGPFADLSYSQWTLDATSQRASSGTVLVQGAGGTQAAINAGAGGYTVDFNINGASSRFSVAR